MTCGYSRLARAGASDGPINPPKGPRFLTLRIVVLRPIMLRISQLAIPEYLAKDGSEVPR